MKRAQGNLFRKTAAAALFWLVAMTGMSAQNSPSAAAAGPEKATRSAEVETIVSHMAEAQYKNRRAVRAYVVTREYKLFGAKQNNAESEVLAEVSFLPPGTKQYEIKKSEGNGRGEKVVRKVLDHEQEMAGEWEETALTARNYNFEFAGEETVYGRRCYVLKLMPKRDMRDLIKGKAWIDAEKFNTVRIVGEPAKSPSWWVKRVELTLTFSDVEGMWMQTGATANADVRIFGKHVLTSQDVKYATGETVARGNQKNIQLERRSQPQRALGTAILTR